MEKLSYVIEDSTIAEVLGVQNFTNEESAVLELVKNAYDAQASNVLIRISRDRFAIIDDGVGMNRKNIKETWMHVGKSDKGYVIGTDDEKRVLAGSKGVGRFAIARLGSFAQVYSKMTGETPVVWETDWNTNTLDTYQEEREHGTTIVIEQLRDNWTPARVRNLKNFLSRTYNDDRMTIQVEYKEEKTEVKKYFGECKLGLHCVSVIKLQYHADSQILVCDIESKEFKEEASRFCPGISLEKQIIELNMADELKGTELSDDQTEEEWKRLLMNVGDFGAELYFSLKNPSSADAERFFYRYRILEDRYDSGVILYRNAFSISSYEGKKDWLGFGKRSRMSPAAATHPTGAWRVRENQMSGKVIIDKKRNSGLSDLMNRQGLVENDIYKLFVEIVLTGITCFERYRQSIIRSIVKTTETGVRKERRLVDLVIKNPSMLQTMSSEDVNTFVDELKQVKNENRESRRQIDETEKKYKYDLRLLNMLATSGLKATSIAHEMQNNRNSIDENVEYIVRALKRYQLWGALNSPENTKYIHRNVPALLEKNKRINRKITTFMDVMLSEAEKEQFLPEEIDIDQLFEEIKKVWEKDYSWIRIFLDIESGTVFKSAKDIFHVVFDNLLLNSIQQNDDENILEIRIRLVKKGKFLKAIYQDSGRGLPSKYLSDPMRILEVHETSRKNGHGIGMWILNNTITGTGGEVQRIDGRNGFLIEFEIGDKI